MQGLKTVEQALQAEERQAKILFNLENSLSKNSLKSYKKDWEIFNTFCDTYGLNSLPATPLTVGDFLSNVITTKGNSYKVASLQRILVVIRNKHINLGYADPTAHQDVKRVFKSIRKNEARPVTQAKAIDMAELKRTLKDMNDSNKALRDSLLLLIGVGGAMRRSEISNIKVSDISYHEHGFSILVPKSKTDQLGIGMVKQFVYGKLPHLCPVRTLAKYLKRFEPTEYLFAQVNRGDNIILSKLSTNSINSIVKRYFPSHSGHSLRATFITETHRKGKSIAEIIQQTGHKSHSQVQSYIRLETKIENNAVTALW